VGCPSAPHHLSLAPPQKNQQDSSFSEEKEAKRLLSTDATIPAGSNPREAPPKVFLVLFLQKKNRFLPDK
jgi:hypothetical protein